jgi:O-antigen ligase
MARSRAGLALTIVALLAIFALAFVDGRSSAKAKAAKLLLAATTFAAILSMQFAVYRILGRFATDPLESSRPLFAHNTITAAKAFMPFGSGLGTFVPVYQMFEKPGDTIANIYVNHAHNDFLEFWLETGIFGPILICLFAIWLGHRSIKLWRRRAADGSVFDCNLGRAATIVIGLLLAHSVVDYPMRTEAIMAVFAVCCGLLVEPLRDAEDGARFAAYYPSRRKAVPKAGEVAPASPKPTSVSPTPPTRPAARRWGEEIDWPEEWRNPAGQTKPDSEH